MKRAAETVEQLQTTYEELQEALAPEALKTTPLASSSQGAIALDQLKKQIKREQMEILALQENNKERRREIEMQKSSSQPATTSDGRLQSEKTSKSVVQSTVEPVLSLNDAERSAPRDAMAAASSGGFGKPGPHMDAARLEQIAAKVTRNMAAATAPYSEMKAQNLTELMTALMDVSNSSMTGAATLAAPLVPLECCILHIFLSALQNRPSACADSTDPVKVSLREPPAATWLDNSAQISCDDEGQMAMVTMSDLKSAVSLWSQKRNLSSDSTTKALYALVAKGLLKIDRRTAKDPFIFFDFS